MSEVVAELEPVRSATSSRGILREVAVITIPSVVTMSARMLMDVTDFIMVTIRGDHDGQAAMLPAQMILWCFIVIGFGIVMMISTYTSQCLGRRRESECGAYAWQGIYIAGLFQIGGFGLWLVLPKLMALLRHDPHVQALQLAYCNVGVLTIGPAIAAESFASFFNGVHRPKVTMWTVIESLAINAVVGWALMFGVFGLPALGIVGAAWGITAATTYRTLRLGLTMTSRAYDERYATRHSWRFDPRRTWQVLRTGVPQALQWFSDIFVWAFFVNYLVGTLFGTVHLTASNIAWTYMRIAFVPCIGVGRALTTLVGKAIGQGDPKLAMHYTRIANAATLGFMLALSLLYLWLRYPMVAIFNPDPEIVRIGAVIVICAAIFQFFDGLGITYGAALRGAGDTLWPAVVQIIGHWVILISGGLAIAKLRPQWGSLGPWIMAALLIIVLGLALWWRWQRGAWQRIDLFKERPATAMPAVAVE
jgi:MATE family multidrug resistance protein